MKKYQVIIKNKTFEIIQDDDGKFIIPEYIKEQEQFGTALKPSFEPIIVARKPFKGSLVDNVIEYGVGGINIDECRVGNETIKTQAKTSKDIFMHTSGMLGCEESYHQGRFPANTILTYDETDFDEVCGGFPNTKSIKSARGGARNTGENIFGKYDTLKNNYECGFNDSGSASRYFYCAKASAKDRNEGLDVEIEEYVLKENTPKEIEQLILNSLTS